MTPALRFMVIAERNLLLSMEMSFFVVCPLHSCECKAPKIGMNCNQSLIILFPFDSSRFSGQISSIYKGITKKDISMLWHWVSQETLKSSGIERNVKEVWVWVSLGWFIDLFSQSFAPGPYPNLSGANRRVFGGRVGPIQTSATRPT